jgi:II/X family phage/plasmid replication protein
MIDADGSIEWQSPRLRSVQGSCESTLMLRTVEQNRLLISGNPARWLQGHNLFGSNDLLGLVATSMEQATILLGITPSPPDRDAWATGDYDLARVDCTGMWSLRTRGDVRCGLS